MFWAVITDTNTIFFSDQKCFSVNILKALGSLNRFKTISILKNNKVIFLHKKKRNDFLYISKNKRVYISNISRQLSMVCDLINGEIK